MEILEILKLFKKKKKVCFSFTFKSTVLSEMKERREGEKEIKGKIWDRHTAYKISAQTVKVCQSYTQLISSILFWEAN